MAGKMLKLREGDPDSTTITVSARMRWWVRPLIWGAGAATMAIPERHRGRFAAAVGALIRDHGVMMYHRGRRLG